MSWNEVFLGLGRTVASRCELKAAGASGRLLTSAVASGSLIRVRRDHYALPSTPPSVLQAVRVGGRIGCVTALRAMGVFAVETGGPHIQLPRDLSRPRSPNNRRAALTPQNRAGALLHWSPLLDETAGDEVSVGLLDALAQTARCAPLPFAVASIDNAMFLGLVDRLSINDMLATLPRHLRRMTRMLEPRSEAGQESVLRLLLDQAGLEYEVQVTFAGMGRVDFVVEGVLVLEADSRLAHDGWELHVRDRGRDLELARRGYMSLRPAYQHTMDHPELVIEAVLELLASRGIAPRRA